MKSLSGKERCKLLEKKGWKLKKIQGSHHIYIKKRRNERIADQSITIKILKSAY